MDLLKFLLDNSFFVYQGVYYHQSFGCAMGSPVSAVLAELVMIDIETRALSTIASQPRWWKRYVDDSSTCLKRTDVVKFHSHLNSINPHIQFTIEYPDVTTGTQSIAFLDCKISVQPERTVQVKVHRKITHTNKYLDFNSHNPIQHKKAVVKTCTSAQGKGNP